MNRGTANKNKRKKGRRRRCKKEPLSFCESPVEGEYYESEPAVYAALHPITAAPTLDYKAVGKWVSPQFKKENIVDTRKGKQRARDKDRCREDPKLKTPKMKPYKLRSSVQLKCRPTLSFSGKTHSLKDVTTPPERAWPNVDEYLDFDFQTPEFGNDKVSQNLRKHPHHLFSASTPKWNRSVTVLAEDTP